MRNIQIAMIIGFMLLGFGIPAPVLLAGVGLNYFKSKINCKVCTKQFYSMLGCIGLAAVLYLVAIVAATGFFFLVIGLSGIVNGSHV